MRQFMQMLKLLNIFIRIQQTQIKLKLQQLIVIIFNSLRLMLIYTLNQQIIIITNLQTNNSQKMGAQPTVQMSSATHLQSQHTNFRQKHTPGQPIEIFFKQNQYQPYYFQQMPFYKSKQSKNISSVELYHVSINAANALQLERQLNFYKIRQNLCFLSNHCQSRFSNSLVSLYHIQQITNTACSNTCGWINHNNTFAQRQTMNHNKQYALLIQKVPYRLSQAKQRDFTFSEAIYIIRDTLKAYHILSDYGINSRTTLSKIGIKQNGEIKVWVNQNFSINGIKSDFCSNQEESIQILVFQLSLILPLQQRKKLREYFQAIIQQIKKQKVAKMTEASKIRNNIVCYQDILNQLKEWELNEDHIKRSIVKKVSNKNSKESKSSFYISKQDSKIKQTNHSLKSSSTESLYIRQKSSSKKSHKQNFSFNGSFRKDSNKKKKSLSLYRVNSSGKTIQQPNSGTNEAVYHFKNVNQIQSIKADSLQVNQVAWQSRSIQQAIYLKNSSKQQSAQQIKAPKYEQRFQMASSIKFTSSIGQQSCNNFSQLLLSKDMNKTSKQNNKNHQNAAQNLKENILTSLHLSQSPDYVFSINQQSFSGQVSFVDHHFDCRKQMQLFPKWQIQEKVKQNAINAFNFSYKKLQAKNIPQFGLR